MPVAYRPVDYTVYKGPRADGAARLTRLTPLTQHTHHYAGVCAWRVLGARAAAEQNPRRAINFTQGQAQSCRYKAYGLSRTVIIR